jgi:carboxyl-terminal processing protease
LDNGSKIVSIVGRNGYHYDVLAQDNNVDIQKPVVLLIDGSSASASEILSGALKDYKRAKLVGTKTYGKGMVQKIISLPNETGINLTVAKYLTPSGKDINKQGIEPDIVENLTIKDITEKNDRQFEKAKDVLESLILAGK